jgi:tetratricopeptide (TPR) repeat protein
MNARPRIFISAVSKELHSARQLVANTLTYLGYEPVWQDIFGTEQGDIRQMLRRRIDSCEGLIQLVGQRSGFSPTDPEIDTQAVSFTQYELLYALETGKKTWPILLGDDFPADTPHDEAPARRALQQRYRQRLQAGGDLYQSAGDLQVLESLVLKLRQLLEELREEWRREQRHAHRFRVLAGAALVILIGLGGLGLRLGWWIKRDTARTHEATTRISQDVAIIKDDGATMKAALIDLVHLRNNILAVTPSGGERIPDSVLFSEIEKKHGLAAGTLDRKLPETAKQLAGDLTATLYERALGASAARDFAEAERLALQAAAEARKKLPLVNSNIVQALELAGWSAKVTTNALAHFTAAAALIDKSANPIEWADVHHGLSVALRSDGQYREAEALLLQIVPIQMEKRGAEHRATIANRLILAHVIHDLGRHQEAEELIRPLLSLVERIRGPEYRETLTLQYNLASFLYGRGKYAEAEAGYRDVQSVADRLWGPEAPLTLAARMNVARARRRQGHLTGIEAEYRAIIKIQERVFGLRDPATLVTRNNLATILQETRQYDEAEKENRSRILIEESILGPTHPDVLTSRNNLAEVLRSQGRLAEAEAEHRDVLRLRKQSLPADHPDIMQSHNNLGVVFSRQKKYPEAETEYRLAYEGRRNKLTSEHPLTLRARANLANCLAVQGRLREAELEHRAILEVRERLLRPGHPDIASSLYDVAVCLEDQNKLDEALPLAAACPSKLLSS